MIIRNFTIENYFAAQNCGYFNLNYVKLVFLRYAGAKSRMFAANSGRTRECKGLMREHSRAQGDPHLRR